MVSDACFGGVPTVLSGGRGRQMPFDVRCSGYERDIVQVDDLPLGVSGAVEYTRKKEDEAPSAASQTLARRTSARCP